MVGTIRGAITVSTNEEKEILLKTRELLKDIMEKNNLEIETVISIFFSATRDITKAYPAVAARQMGFTQESLFCTQEMYVENSLPMCIRICMFVNDLAQKDAKHVYLGGAAKLRPDIS